MKGTSIKFCFLFWEKELCYNEVRSHFLNEGLLKATQQSSAFQKLLPAANSNIWKHCHKGKAHFLHSKAVCASPSSLLMSHISISFLHYFLWSWTNAVFWYWILSITFLLLFISVMYISIASIRSTCCDINCKFTFQLFYPFWSPTSFQATMPHTIDQPSIACPYVHSLALNSSHPFVLKWLTE